MALATGDARRLMECLVGKINGGNSELALTAQEALYRKLLEIHTCKSLRLAKLGKPGNVATTDSLRVGQITRL